MPVAREFVEKILKGSLSTGGIYIDIQMVGGKPMLGQLQRTVEEWNNRSHLLPFLKKGPLVVCIKTEDEAFYIHINSEKVELMLEENHHPINAELQGKKVMLLSLLRGEMKLRQAKESNLVTLKSSFRTELYLETMFYLVKPYDHVSDL